MWRLIIIAGGVIVWGLETHGHLAQDGRGQKIAAALIVMVPAIIVAVAARRYEDKAARARKAQQSARRSPYSRPFGGQR